MKATVAVAVLLALILLAGCSLPVNYVANLQNLAAPPAELPTEELLTGEDARQIALHHAKAEEAAVRGLQISFEFDEGIPEYDISFGYLNYEFEYEIHGISGRILSYEREKQ